MICLLKLFVLLLLTGCSVLPGYKAVKVDYCERVNGIIYCDDERIDTNYYAECSIYDDEDCENRR